MVISPVNCNGWFRTTLTPRRPDQQTSNTSSKHPGADAALFSTTELVIRLRLRNPSLPRFPSAREEKG
ncbi:MAG TPA: hypothetical protein VGP76_15550, partial [Planctomycetaceae bacterium]|nr:hypothetical protein [Planctomycetaceae bacterium]